MLLRRILESYNYKQKVEDKQERSVRHKAMMKVIRDIRENHLADIRKEMAAIPDKEKLRQFVYLDDMISLKVILTVIEELRYAHQDEQFERLKRLTQDERDQSIYLAGIEAAVKNFESFLKENAVEAVTGDNVFTFMCQQSDTLCFRLASECCFDQKYLDEKFEQDIHTDIALACLKKFFEQSDKRQTSTWSLTTAFVGLNADGVLKPYAAMPVLMACITPILSTIERWRELNVWMEGVHFYHAGLLKRALQRKNEQCSTDNNVIVMPENKPYPPINNQDEAMKFRFQVTFYDLAKYVHVASHVLASKLQVLTPDARLTALSQAGLFSASSAAAAASVNVDDQCEQMRPAYAP